MPLLSESRIDLGQRPADYISANLKNVESGGIAELDPMVRAAGEYQHVRQVAECFPKGRFQGPPRRSRGILWLRHLAYPSISRPGSAGLSSTHYLQVRF